ncbi:MAG: N-acetyl-gamma-glutamyl-phosphate reductase [Candidatus Dormibacteraeota bacterium]|nr:N-acetyl-gamma-glutamyl-phosphate reductase [Candidatus Dormibacteraeota bacterium]
MHDYAGACILRGVTSGLRVAVAGATGYIGMQCTALLARHPETEIVRLMGRSHAGQRHGDAVPGSEVEVRLEDTLDIDSADVVFSALPHTVAAAHASRWLDAGAVVIDLSADFRLRDAEAYQRWYGTEHPAPSLCSEAVYGLVETHRDTLRTADLIAVPGCYPTATLIACVPALQSGLVEPDVIVDAKSGVSGAGRSPSLGVHFAEVNESVTAYAVSGHRHRPEMLQELSAAAGSDVHLTFVPHLVPMTRGILATAYLRPKRGVTAKQLEEAYAAFAADNSFIRLRGDSPSTKQAAGTNDALVNVGRQDGMAVVTVAIDNLLKGAAGQAVQAMNVRFGFDESAGLEARPLWP